MGEHPVDFVKLEGEWYIKVPGLLEWLEKQQELSGHEAASLCKFLRKEITSAIGRDALGIKDT